MLTFKAWVLCNWICETPNDPGTPWEMDTSCFPQAVVAPVNTAIAWAVTATVSLGSLRRADRPGGSPPSAELLCELTVWVSIEAIQ